MIPPPQFPYEDEVSLKNEFCCGVECWGEVVENKDMISALAVCGRPAGDVGALKSRSNMLDPVGAGGAAPAVAWGAGAAVAGGCVVLDGGAVVIGGGTSSDPNRSTTGAGAGAAGVGLGACVRDNSG